jgi:zinc and cadmium transporter
VSTLVYWVLLFSLLSSVGAVGAAALLLLAPDRTRETLQPYLVSFATGTLLASALLELLPHAIEHLDVVPSLSVVLGGLVLFFILERLMIWRHCHVIGHCETHRTAGHLILIGDTIHNFVDGIVLAAAFLSSIPLGMATGLAIIAHEVPQEVGDFAILIESGFSKKRALIWNMLSGSATIPGALISLVALESIQPATPYILSLSAAGFLYIGLADLIPGLHERRRPGFGAAQFLFIILGIVTILLLHSGPG